MKAIWDPGETDETLVCGEGDREGENMAPK